ncbi:MAG: cation diffusion facilitator family transporter [Deltaproteobacteria bacterium]|nr:cation diffusion facilitator family transporter [Deltaproteobacteria bacterium]
MITFTRWVAARWIPEWQRVRDPLVRERYGTLEGWVSIWVNLILALIKGVLGVMMGSAGLIADAVHSLSDLASSVVVIISFRAAQKPPDPEHPFGHAKAEYVATLVVALMMVVAGLEIGKDNLSSLFTPTLAQYPTLTWGVFFLLVTLALAKEALALFSYELGRMIQSETLAADGWHHRTDALSTGVVILGLAGGNFGIRWLDGVAGMLVGMYIMYIGLRMAWKSISPLLGEMAPKEDLVTMRSMAQSVPGVVNTHDLTVHQYGHFYFTTLHVEVSDRLDVHAMHGITVLIETRILKRFPGECVVHVDPVNLHHPLLNRVTDVLKDAVVARPRLIEFHDLNLWQDNGQERGMVEVTVTPDTDPKDYPGLIQELQAEVTRRFPQLALRVELKVDFTATPLVH